MVRYGIDAWLFGTNEYTRWMHGRMDRLVDVRAQRTNQRTGEPTNQQTNEPTNQRTNERTNNPMNERTVRQTSKQSNI